MLAKVNVRQTIKTVRVYGAGSAQLTLWEVRYPSGELYGHSSTWQGAWRLACQCVGWKVPRV